MSGGHMMMRRGHRAQTPTPTPSPLVPPRYWGWYGDSHTDGREPVLAYRNPFVIFRRIWLDTFAEQPLTTSVNGVGGRDLAETLLHCLSRTFAGVPWIHIQESGDQANDGQRTASEFGATFEQGWRDIDQRWPGCFKSYETAHSFSPARKAEPDHNWDSYNVELLERVAVLASSGITVHVVDTARYIDLMIAEFGYDVVCFPDAHVSHYHFQGLGNFGIAIGMYKRFGYDVTLLNHSGVELDDGQKSTTISIIAGAA